SLLKIIRDYNLEQYNTAVTVKKNVLPAIENASQERTEKIQAAMNDDSGIEYSRNSFFPRGIFTINRSKVVFALAGTLIKDISRQYDISPEEIMAYNDLPETFSLMESQLIYLERRLKKSNKAFRIAQQGETWKDISQLEGIRLEQLMLYNQVTRPETPVPAGQKIWLQPTSESNTSLSGTH
ncbi:MAG: LysM peptidoglycan-binding domain-containing protein, partial [Chitinophagaceae bacterium]|nr:LysM peptidoglycan-binding domain-containing protein [Chitinophagaceae bacterium]